MASIIIKETKDRFTDDEKKAISIIFLPRKIFVRR